MNKKEKIISSNELLQENEMLKHENSVLTRINCKLMRENSTLESLVCDLETQIAIQDAELESASIRASLAEEEAERIISMEDY